MEKKYQSQFVSGTFVQDSTRCVPQHERNNFVTLATYWVPDLFDIQVFPGHLERSILTFGSGASTA